MSNNILATNSMVAKEALMVLKNMCSFAANVDRSLEDEFKSTFAQGYAPGTTFNKRKPPRYVYRDGAAANPQATIHSTVPLTVNQGGADLSFTIAQRSLSISKKSFEESVYAATMTVVNEMDRRGLQLAHDSFHQVVNAAGAIPTTSIGAMNIFTDSGTKLDYAAAPRDGRRAIILNPTMNGASVSGLAGLFNNQEKLDKQYGRGMMVDSLGYIVAMDQNAVGHTNGAGTASNINGAGQTGATLTVAATGAGTITKGTIITLPGVYSVNPQSRQSTGQLMSVIITADVAQGSTSLPISPALVTSGAFQNVTGSPTTGQPFVIQGAASTAYGASYAFHKEAISLACVPFAMPYGNKGVLDVAQETADGFSVKVTTAYDFMNDVPFTRLDVLYGYAAMYPELGVRIHNV